jgi:transcription elongation factor Elf1
MDKEFRNECPNCGSDNLDFDSIELEGEIQKQWVQCEACGLGFNIWSEPKWVYVEDTILHDSKHIE